ncbi:response regulator transcription factor [Brochothrix thermosphacta]|uniref:Putative two-component system, response regulator n=1 Tax=Brochothrix thermosphacta TaxID=2756 RepID=A0A2X0QH89_BROTH|nr:response regulator transcription factor [Brochothrix thermosphacta]ANZ94110.1 DNA-binding response regulator [Brochothrix thermosphacta]EUJ34011.1 sensory transduction protein ycbL [Brochothrix thermosphacta DSM 20171 = FSL F6-1036]MDO7862954.1 response regulator transcription factor [Brochothrix thermosphacta]ODJ50530.1 DNA-binding response regulator [Brochothrix thermosphacta DSM 20171 = FSL F6-1036]ODJ60212.1 DNA-binding response regulator [Brochothrix thermosphacta]
MKRTILLVDDERTIIDISKKYLEKEGYRVFQATSAKEAMSIYDNQTIDLIITDIMMPEIDGYEFIMDTLEKNEQIPFIFITAKNANQDRLYSLTLGADDYITKPFNPLELVLRVKNILRRVYRETDKTIEIAQLSMDFDRRFVKIGEQSLDLTTKEFMLLWVLSNDSDKVFSKSEILSLVWDSYSRDDRNTVNVHIHRLREKLAPYSDIVGAPLIKTIWGTGYKLEVTS